jgi:flagellar basal-body rod protein FlgB
MKVSNYLFNNRIPLLNTALDAYSMRMTTAAKNIANIDTVGYKPQQVKFEELFQSNLISLRGSRTSEQHIPLGKNPNPRGEVTNEKIPAAEVCQSGENDVNIDREMAEVAETQIKFQFASQTVSKYFKQMSAAITGNSNY